MKTFNRVLALSLVTALVMVARAGTWYVDCQVETDGYDGLAESYDPATGHGPKKYIQSAVALAEAAYDAGDHQQQVIVLPGSYATGENYLSNKSAANMCASRVVISKPLTLTGKGGKEQTEIVGRYGTIAEADKSSPNVAYFENLGTDAVRCVFVATAAAGTVIEGFTLRNGATWYNDNKTPGLTDINRAETGALSYMHHGGGVCVESGANVYVCDCIIRDCWGFYSGIIHNGTAARCKIESCTVGWKNTAAINNTRLSNCLFIRNGQVSTAKTYLVRAASYIVNCTMVGNQLGVMHTGVQTNFNGLCWGNKCEGATSSTTVHFARNTVYSKTEANVKLAAPGVQCSFANTNDCFFSSGTDDLRLMDDSPAIGRGVYSDLAALTADLPERHRLRDYLGNAIVPDANGKINCGAIQEVVKYEDLKAGTLKIHLARMDAFGGRPLVHKDFPYNDALIRSETQSAVTLCTSNNAAVGYFYTALPIAVLADADKTLSVPLPPVGRTLTMVFEQNERTVGKMTVTPDGDDYIASVSYMARPFRGWRLDDGTYAEPWSTSVSLTALGGRSVEPVYTADWYVNPKGSDANNGMAPSLAKKTLQAAMENTSLAMGDTVHAAGGVYDEGEMWGKFVENAYLPDSDLTTSNLPSRVVVPMGVTLLADEGPEKTFIVGRAATDSSSMGLGAGAMRCVLLFSSQGAFRSVLDGFTLTGGRTLNAPNGKGSYQDSDNAGGGVASDKIGIETAGIVRNCIISNCCARIGGGSYGSRLVNTRVYDVNASEGAASFFGYFNGCAFDQIRTDDQILRNYRTEVVGCTFGRELYNANGTTRKTFIGNPNASGVRFCNNVVRIPHSYSASFESVAHCVLAEGSLTNDAKSVADCRIYSADEFAALVDSENRPIAGTEDETISKGGDVALHNWNLCGDADAVGASRLSNGSLSIGAYQADWRAQYAKVLCGGRAKVDVTSVSTNVTWTYGTDYLRLHDGDSLSLKTKKPPVGPGSLAQDVTGGGQLTVMDGAVAVSPTDDVYTVFAHDNDTLSVSCTAADAAFADIGSLTLAKLGLLLMVR